MITLTSTPLLLFSLLSTALSSPLVQRNSSEALGNIQYLTTEWTSYTTSLVAIYDTANPSHHHDFNASALPLATQYAIIAIESNYNQNFEYESYPIGRIALGPPLNESDSKVLVDATKELVRALKPLFEAVEPFVDVIGKDNVASMLGYQDIISQLISAVEGVVYKRQKEEMQRQSDDHAKIVAVLKEDLLDGVR